jgi:tetratricopeptide (TPR) repeat protein
VGLDGARLQIPIVAVVSNYVCCVTPPKMLRKREDGWSEKFVRTAVEPPNGDARKGGQALLQSLLAGSTDRELMSTLSTEVEWRDVDLGTSFREPFHRRSLERLLAGFSEATVTYPYCFVDCLRTLAESVAPGGVVIVNDYGNCRASDMRGAHDRTTEHYGNTQNNMVDFAVFDAVAAEAGWAIKRTDDPLNDVHTAAICFEPGPSAGRFAQAFQRHFIDQSPGEEVMRHYNAGFAFAQRQDFRRAAAMYRRCVEMDPDNAEHHYQLGLSCVEGGLYEQAAEFLERGLKTDPYHTTDMEFELARAYEELGKVREAIDLYRSSLDREDHPVTHCNLALAHIKLEEWKQAHEAIKRSLALDPESERAQETLDKLKAALLEKLED